MFPKKGQTSSTQVPIIPSVPVPVHKDTNSDPSSVTPKDTANQPSDSGNAAPPLSSPPTAETGTEGANQPALDDIYSAETEVDEPPPVVPISSTGRTKRKYGCRLCKTWLESAQALKDHHVQTHGIMYCSECNKAFNNQLSLPRHQYEHKSCPFICRTCGEDFPFESQYKTHLFTQSNRRRFGCTYTDCSKRFKNKGDMKRHIKEHSSAWLTCPDCPDYRIKEKRNFESYRLKHSNIEKSWCELCGQFFVFNTQKL